METIALQKPVKSFSIKALDESWRINLLWSNITKASWKCKVRELLMHYAPKEYCKTFECSW